MGDVKRGETPRPSPTEIRLHEVLATVEPLLEKGQRLIAVGAAPGSKAAEVAGLPLGGLAWTMAGMFWGAAGDNLYAWHALTWRARVQPMIAHGTLARATLEGAVMARWLLEPGIHAVEHRNRGASSQLSDYRLRMGFEQGAKPTYPRDTQGKPARERERDLIAEMRRLRIPVRGELDMTEAFRRYAIRGSRDGTWLYRLASGFAHGRPWAIATGNMEVLDLPGAPPGSQIVSATASENGALLLAIAARDALAAALDEMHEYAHREAAQ